ncbi:hypothetical protein T4A_5118 [Trichinella pseudospiralis]|uniref:G-protein coupled receptors family 1 profile domain-containing protein n=1 Tax=Trichinella pseudospiralis TaxID=6337 RepID=A0A0V1F079_TRIPS|nr:hypothetical protein T4A_5118 [Trichinella pseudospiralis]
MEVVNASLQSLLVSHKSALVECTSAIVALIGLVEIAISLLGVSVILKSKELRNIHFLTTCILCFNDAVAGASAIEFEIWQILSVYLMHRTVEVAYCCQRLFLLHTVQTNNVMLVAVLSIERTVAIFQPSFYRNVSLWKFPVPLLFAAFMFSLSISSVMVFNGFQQNRRLMLCGSDDCWSSPITSIIFQYYFIAVSVVILLFNGICLVYVSWKARTYRKRNLLNIFRLKYKESVRLMKTTGAIIAVLLILQIFGRLFRIISFYTDDIRVRFSFYNIFRVLNSLSAVSNFFIFLLTSDSFRFTLRSMFTNRSVDGGIRLNFFLAFHYWSEIFIGFIYSFARKCF